MKAASTRTTLAYHLRRIWEACWIEVADRALAVYEWWQRGPSRMWVDPEFDRQMEAWERRAYEARSDAAAIDRLIEASRYPHHETEGRCDM